MFLTFMMKLYLQLQLLFHRKEGATAIEYVILVAVIALVVLAAGKLLGLRSRPCSLKSGQP